MPINSIADLLFAHIAHAEEERGRVYEAVIGVVTNNRDPDKLGRVRLRFPTLSTSDDSAWAPIVSVGAGKARGWFFVPEIDDEVLVLFEHGDIGRPVVVGAMWNGKDKPPRSNGDGKNPVRSIVSRGGSRITFDDDQGTVTLEDGGGAGSITIDKQNKIKLEAKQGDVAIHSKDDLTIVASEIELVSSATLDVVSASGDLKLGADGKIKVAGQALLKVDGAQVAINGGAASAPAMPSANPQEVPMVVGGGGGGGGTGATGAGGGGSATGAGGGGSATGSSGGGGSGAGAAQGGGESGAGVADNPGEIKPGAAGRDDPGEIKPSGPPSPSTPTDLHQIEVQVVDVLGTPQPDVFWELVMPDGSKKSGATGADGFIRVSGLEDTGNCTLTFPDVDTPPPENPDPDDAGAAS